MQRVQPDGPNATAGTRAAVDSAAAPATTGGSAPRSFVRLGLVLGAGVVLELVWLALGALTAWLSEVPAFTARLAPSQQPPWAWLHPLLLAWLGPDRSAPMPPPFVPTAQVAFVLGLAVAGVLYLLALAALQRAHARGAAGMAIVFGLTVVFDLTVCAMPGLLSGDLILYATFGRLAGVHQLDPYVPPVAWPAISQTDSTWWWFVPTPYGPVWTGLSASLAALTASLDPLAQVLAFRGLAALALLIAVGLVWWLVPRLAPSSTATDRLVTVALLGWNPLVLFETGQGHNDILIGVLLLAAVVPLARVGRPQRSGAWLTSIGLLTLDALIKYLPVVPGVFVAALRLRELRSGRARAGAGLAMLAVAAGLGLVSLAPWRESSGVFEALLNATAGGQRYVNSIVDLPTFPIVARYLDKLSEHIPQSLAQVRFWEAVLVRGLLALYLAGELHALWWWAPRGWPAALDAALNAAVRVLLLVIIFGLTQTLDYYFISPLVLATALGWRNRWTQVAVAISLLFLPTFYLRRMDLNLAPDALLIVSLLGPLLVAAALAARRHTRACAG